MKILVKEYDEYILCESTEKDGNTKVIIHFKGFKYANEYYDIYSQAQKYFKTAREYLNVKRLKETKPISKEKAISTGTNIIEIDNILPKGVKKMVGITEGYK